MTGKTSQGTPYDVPTTVTVPGANDVTADPQFVDDKRNFWRWTIARGYTAVTAAGTEYTFSGTTAQYKQIMADGVAAIKLDPSTRIPDLLAYVRAGFRPKNAALKGKTYAGDAMTTDAGGNPLAGTIGAMAAQVTTPVAPIPVLNNNRKRRTSSAPPRVRVRPTPSLAAAR
jgi:hypothetical protein